MKTDCAIFHITGANERSGGARDIVSDFSALERLGLRVIQIRIDGKGFEHAGDRLSNKEVGSLLSDIPTILFSGFLSVERVLGTVEMPSNALKILNVKDLHFLRERRCEAVTSASRSWAGVLSRELRSIRLMDVVLTYSEVELALLRRLAPAVRSERHFYFDPFGSRPRVVPPFKHRFIFVGNFFHLPNRDGIAWFLSQFGDVLRSFRLPIDIYGSGGMSGLPDYATYHGEIEDLGEVYRSGGIMLAPLRFGAGIRIKLVEAALAGLPILATAEAIEGLPLDESTVMLFDDRESLASAVHAYISTPEIVKEKVKKSKSVMSKFSDGKKVQQSFARFIANQLHYSIS